MIQGICTTCYFTESAAILTSLDGDGIAIIGAVQLPGKAQLALWEHHLVLLLSLAAPHDKLLAIKAHCAAQQDWIECHTPFLACIVLCEHGVIDTQLAL